MEGNFTCTDPIFTPQDDTFVENLSGWQPFPIRIPTGSIQTSLFQSSSWFGPDAPSHVSQTPSSAFWVPENALAVKVHGDCLVHWEAEPAEPTLEKGTVYPKLPITEQYKDFKRAVVYVRSRYLQRRIIAWASVNYRPPNIFLVPGSVWVRRQHTWERWDWREKSKRRRSRMKRREWLVSLLINRVFILLLFFPYAL